MRLFKADDIHGYMNVLKEVLRMFEQTRSALEGDLSFEQDFARRRCDTLQDITHNLEKNKFTVSKWAARD